jgi:DMSO/TMAO reductase YedYZ molybdopterin-dependent catalytic subunit
MITREKEPANLEMPFSQLDGAITPTEHFYVRSHFPVPQIDVGTWRLHVGGKVAQPLELSYDDLRKLGARTIQATIECAGNSRVFLVPKVKGVQWELGAVGNAEWTGVLLRDVLERTGAPNNAREVILEGADSGSIAELPRPAGKIHFARSLPMEKAMDDVLLAYEINGAPLTPAHGFPLRAVVPGWYGMASIKWLQRIIITDEPFNGYYQAIDYAFWEPGENGPVLRPLTEMQVKAEIAQPQTGEIVAANEKYTVRGAAWSSGTEITKVEVSTDGGSSWNIATLIGEHVPNAWRLWDYQWRTPGTAGSRTLLARATDSAGRSQPDSRDANRGTYMINHCLPIEVEVR